MAAVTRLGLIAITRSPYGSFAGKSEFTPPTSVETAGTKHHIVYDDLLVHVVYDCARTHVVYDDLITHTVRSN